MFKEKMESLSRHGRRISSKVTPTRYKSLNYEDGYQFHQGIAYGQLNQVLDLAARKPRKAKNLAPIAHQWLKVIERLDAEQETPTQPSIGFQVSRKEAELDDDTTESDEQTDVPD